MQRRRRPARTAVAALASVVLQVVAVVGPVSAATSDPTVVGSWSDPMPLGIVGVHAALLPTGKVLFFELPGSTLGHARVFDPLTGTSVPAAPPFDWSVFCSGMSMLPDGRVFLTGGEAPRSDNPPGTGVQNAAFFDPFTQTWTAAPPMAYARWYDSNVNMPDGSVMVMGGDRVPRDLYADAAVRPVERYDPATNAWSTLPTSADIVGRYLRGMLLPDGHILAAGTDATTREFDPVTQEWTDVSTMRFGDRDAGGVVLLPGLRRVLTSGGYPSEDDETATATAEVLDLSAPDPQWTATGSMAKARANHNLVLLPDGTVLAVGGGQQGAWTAPVKSAELYDPASGTWRTMAGQTAPRSYHSTALLLPDGRVISAGSNSGSPYESTVEIYRPPYLFRGPRPTIASAPGDVTYGGSFDVETPDAGSIARVALIPLGVVTHGWADDQRYVDLDFTRDDGALHVTGPTDAAEAPAGPYMLFILDGTGVPSVASIVSVSSSASTFTLDVGTDGAATGSVTSDVGGIDCPAACSATGLAHYGHVLLTATPDTGSAFAGWSDPGCPDGSSTCDVTMGSDRTVTATFEPAAVSTTLKDDDPHVAFNGWSGIADASASGGAYRISGVKNDTAVWKSPSTTSLTWVTRAGPDRGRATVTIDGKGKGTVDLFAPTSASAAEVFSGLVKRAHTVVIKVLHTKDPASSSYGVPLDAFVAGATTAQESSAAVAYDTWKSVAQSHATDGTYRSSGSAQATVTVTFTGTGIDWVTAKGDAYGRAAVRIDGLSQGTVDLYQRATAWRSVVAFSGLSAGSHTMVIQVLGQKDAAARSAKVVVDGFVVHR
jgi:hypothetical protein